MYVQRLRIFDAEDRVVENPTWADVERAIRSLNGKTRTALNLFHDERSPDMVIGGGRRRLYHVMVGRRGVGPINLVNPSAKDDEIEMLIGGYGTDFPMWALVDLPTALVAAKTFWDQGKLDESLHWFEGGTREWNRRRRGLT
jgi:Immunity protein Imm1